MVEHGRDGEAGWRQMLRATQSTWREQAGLAAGADRHGEPLGSALTSHDAEAGRNFLTDTIWERVQSDLQHAAAAAPPKPVLRRDRLLGNLLSSQPLCFNLFAELDTRTGRRLITKAARLLWPGVVDQITKVEFEWSPGRDDKAFLGNRSAFDVALFHTTPDDGTGVIGIEVKYHEDLTGTAGDLRARAVEVAEAAGIDATKPKYQQGRLNQLLLDHLLALSIGQHPEQPFGRARFVLLYPAANPACARATAEYGLSLIHI